MGPHERLCRMLGLPVPAPDVLAAEEDLARELASLTFDERQVTDLIARLRADGDLLARFRATAPADEAAALREAACALLGMVAAERAVRLAEEIRAEEAAGGGAPRARGRPVNAYQLAVYEAPSGDEPPAGLPEEGRHNHGEVHAGVPVSIVLTADIGRDGEALFGRRGLWHCSVAVWPDRQMGRGRRPQPRRRRRGGRRGARHPGRGRAARSPLLPAAARRRARRPGATVGRAAYRFQPIELHWIHRLQAMNILHFDSL